MRIKFSEHAIKQRLGRKIPKKYILDTIKNPQNKLDSYRGRKLLQREFSGKILEVVTFSEEDETTVVTQYYLEEEENENNLR